MAAVLDFSQVRNDQRRRKLLKISPARRVKHLIRKQFAALCRHFIFPPKKDQNMHF